MDELLNLIDRVTKVAPLPRSVVSRAGWQLSTYDDSFAFVFQGKSHVKLSFARANWRVNPSFAKLSWYNGHVTRCIHSQGISQRVFPVAGKRPRWNFYWDESRQLQHFTVWHWNANDKYEEVHYARAKEAFVPIGKAMSLPKRLELGDSLLGQALPVELTNYHAERQAILHGSLLQQFVEAQEVHNAEIEAGAIDIWQGIVPRNPNRPIPVQETPTKEAIAS